MYFRPRGHGTYVDDDKLTASVAGRVQRVDKLICVRPLQTRSVIELKLLNMDSIKLWWTQSSRVDKSTAFAEMT